MRPLPRRALAGLSWLLIAFAPLAAAQEVKQTPPNEVPATPRPEPDVFRLDMSPAELPVPALRYRFLPEVGELNPGDAAPIYLRLNQEIATDRIEQLNKQLVAWSELPTAQLPLKEAEQLIQDWSGRLRQLEYGTRRETCRWEYPLREEADQAFEILLPDAQAMRTWGRLLALKARVEIASGRLDQATGTIETGVAFGRHVAYGPFLINRLVGIAIIESMLYQANELVARPDAPNLYWAFTSLPRPLVGMRDAVEIDRLAIGTTMTGHPLTSFNPARPRADAEWTILLTDLHARMVRVNSVPGLYGAKALDLPDLDGFRRAMLTPSRAYLRGRGIEAKTDDQALVLAIMGTYRDLLDERTKRADLPFAEDQKLPPVDEAAEVKAAAAGPAAVFAQLLPATSAVQKAEVRLDRRVAALRVVEALQLHAARNGGQWPDRLDQINAVPVPLDPVTGTPFEYHRDGAKATLTGPTIPGTRRLFYNLSLRP